MPSSESRFRNVYLFHGKGGSPDGSVLAMEAILLPQFWGVTFERPRLLHSDSIVSAEKSFDHLALRWIKTAQPDSLIVGVSLGGMLACKLQELVPEFNFSVLALMSPTNYDEIRLTQKFGDNRVALYSTLDPVIKGRTNWPDYATQQWDVAWLREHDIDRAKYASTFMVAAYMAGANLALELDNMFPITRD